MMKLSDALTVIRNMPPGLAIFGGIYTPQELTAIYVREESAQIKKLPKTVTVEMRAGMMQQDSVFQFFVIFRFPDLENPLFETCWNWFAPGNKKWIENMAKQDILPIFFVGDSGKEERKIGIRNSLKQIFSESIPKWQASNERWSMNDFNKTRETVYQKYTDINSLWKVLG